MKKQEQQNLEEMYQAFKKAVNNYMISTNRIAFSFHNSSNIWIYICRITPIVKGQQILANYFAQKMVDEGLLKVRRTVLYDGYTYNKYYKP